MSFEIALINLNFKPTKRQLAASECPQFDLIPDEKLPRIEAEEKLLFDSLITEEVDPNGGSRVLIADQDEINARLDRSLHRKFAIYFLSIVYSESTSPSTPSSPLIKDEETSSLKENNEGQLPSAQSPSNFYYSNYALGIVRNSARSMPDLIDYFAHHYPNMIVKSSLLLNSKEINTLRISDYQRHVRASFQNGTFRYGPLLQASIVGVRNEEIGDYFPEFIDQYLESNPFLEPVMPWGSLSINENMLPQHSNDGPIIWAR